MKKRSRKFKISIFLIATFAAWVILAPFFAVRLIVEKNLEKADAILVLAGSSQYLERTAKAAELCEKGVAPKIILTDDGERSGWSRPEQRNIPFVELAKRNLVSLGVPAENIEIIKPAGSGTIYEAQIIEGKARIENWHAVMLVTSPYHTRRTLWAFERVFENEPIEIGIAAPTVAEKMPPVAVWWIFPNGWRNIAGEYVKSWYYWLYY